MPLPLRCLNHGRHKTRLAINMSAQSQCASVRQMSSVKPFADMQIAADFSPHPSQSEHLTRRRHEARRRLCPWTPDGVAPAV